MLGGVHGKDQKKVFAELCTVIEEWIAISEKDGDDLPPGMAGEQYSGKFNLRLGKPLHERLAIEAAKEGKSLNAPDSNLHSIDLLRTTPRSSNTDLISSFRCLSAIATPKAYGVLFSEIASSSEVDPENWTIC